MGGVRVTVETVGRQCGHVVLLRLPLIVVLPSSAVRTISGLPLRLVRADACCIDVFASTILLDEAGEVAGGRGVGARLVPGAWRKSAVGELGDQASGSEVSDRGQQGGDATDDVVGIGVGRLGRAGFGCGGVEQHHAGDLVGELRGEALDVQAAERVTGQHVRPGNVGASKQRVQVRGDVVTVLRAVGGVAPAATGAVVHADSWCRGPRPAQSSRGRRRTRRRPGSRTTVGLPEPVQYRCSRCPPTSISWPGIG